MMRLPLFILVVSLMVNACVSHLEIYHKQLNLAATKADKKGCMYCIHDSEERVALLNDEGDTLAPFGKFDYCFFEKTKTFGIVYDQNKNGFFAYDVNGQELFEVFAYDNGPDYIEEGLFRIVDKGKIGYANEKGQVVIQPQFECAYPFEKGKAEVSYSCESKKDGEYTIWLPDSSFYINQKGVPVN